MLDVVGKVGYEPRDRGGERGCVEVEEEEEEDQRTKEKCLKERSSFLPSMGGQMA